MDVGELYIVVGLRKSAAEPSCAATSPWRPAKLRSRLIRRVGDGYRYDGLYFVESFWQETGQAGYLVWRFKLVKAPP